MAIVGFNPELVHARCAGRQDLEVFAAKRVSLLAAEQVIVCFADDVGLGSADQALKGGLHVR
jgi:hypothetical protein